MKALGMFLVAATLAVLAACGNAPQIATTYPDDVERLLATDTGAALHEYGYDPVVVLYDYDGNPIGTIYAFCGDASGEEELRECGEDHLNRGTAERPSLHVDGSGNLTQLTSPYDGELNYRLNVPSKYKDFSSLTVEVQETLLGVMPEAVKAYKSAVSDERDEADGANGELVNTSIGQVWVEAYRF